MAKKKAPRKSRPNDFEADLTEPLLKDSTKHAIIGISAVVLACFFIASSWGLAGAAGRLTYRGLGSLFGTGYFILPLILILLSISFFKSIRPNLVISRLAAGLIFFVSLLGIISIISRGHSWISGGLVGQSLATPLVKLFDIYSLILLGASLVVSLLVIFDTPIRWPNFLRLKRRESEATEPALASTPIIPTIEPITSPPPTPTEELTSKISKPKEPVGDPGEASFLERITGSSRRGNNAAFVPPPLSLLEHDSGKPGAGDIKANANIIKRTLQNFGIIVEMDEVSIGPSITRYAFKPAEGVKLSRILALQNDLSLALAAHPIRIEAPIPGKSLVGIEIPNRVKSTVGLASLLSSKDYGDSPHPLLVALGRGISGQPQFANVAKAPHMLIAGATGSGKSVTIHTLITSLLYRNPADRLRFIMVDPKRVELTLYNKIPHLLTPVVTDAKKAIMVLKWATKEMERRYNILETCAVRDIQSYHKNVVDPVYAEAGEQQDDSVELPEKMPYIVIIIDELADIMTAYPRELEGAIVRLAQMSRAVGIHLMLSTQRPSVDVITGLIKANIPTRVALQVASQIDSRTILDMPGAEKLLGSGDMLYLSGEMAKPVRLQSAFISEEEVKKVVNYIAKEYEPDTEAATPDLALGGNEATAGGINIDLEDHEASGDDDELYEEARVTVIQAGKASASFLQRKLKVGYARAARLLDMLEERGVIGPGEGAKQREVYEKYESSETTI